MSETFFTWIVKAFNHLEKGGVLGSIESFFVIEISFNRELKKKIVQQEINK